MAYEKQFAALSHSLRQGILKSLGVAPKSVRELTDAFGATQPAISQHLKVLREAGLIDARTEGTRNIYCARAEGLDELRGFIEQQWTTILTSLDED